MTRDTIAPEVREEWEREGWKRIGAWTFHAPVPPEYEGHCLTYEAVRIEEHWHIWVHSGRHVGYPTSVYSAENQRYRTGFAGKLILRPAEWLVLREALDHDQRIGIFEVENPLPGQALRYACSSPGEADKAT